MERKLWGIFRGNHLVAMFGFVVLAVALPGTLWAVDTFSNVAIEDPVTGKKAIVDGQRRVWTYSAPSHFDQLASYRNNPANAVDIFFNLVSGNCSSAYDIPAGKALVVTALSGANAAAISTTNSGYYLRGGGGCGGAFLSIGLTSDAASPIAVSFESGIVIPASVGALSVNSVNNNGYVFVHGYLVPAVEAPAGAWQKMAGQDAASIAAKLAAARRASK